MEATPRISTDVVILGARLAANLTAAYLKKKMPDLGITVVGRIDRSPPVVGESTIEGTTLFLHECGLAKLLQENHFHKFGLTFYFKTNIDDPSDRTYAIHEEPAIPPLPANLVNRFTFDRALIEHNRGLGVTFVDADARDVEVKKGAHTVTVKDGDGRETRITGRWIVDATGRNRVLGKKLGVIQRAPHQRSTYWFRLADFDASILLDLNKEMRAKYPQMREQIAYDPYYVTHHFMGRGNWIWLIPVASPEHQNLISIGITYRPDCYPATIRTLDDFLEHVGREHPVVADMTRSGRITDTNVYLNYFYKASQHYSRDGWFIVGDAANAVDPLYSNGMFLQAIQITQVKDLIERERNGTLSDPIIEDYDRLFSSFYRRAQTVIARFYEVMHDPYQSHLRMHWTTTIYFHCILPWFMSGYHADPDGVRLMTRLVEASEADDLAAWELFRDASIALGRATPHDIVNYYEDTINYRLLMAREHELPAHLAKLSWIYARIRARTMIDARGKGAMKQLPYLVRDASRAALLQTVFRGTSLRYNKVFHRLMGVERL